MKNDFYNFVYSGGLVYYCIYLLPRISLFRFTRSLTFFILPLLPFIRYCGRNLIQYFIEVIDGLGQLICVQICKLLTVTLNLLLDI